MNLFAAAGLDLPTSGGKGARAVARLPHVPLFARKIIDKSIGAKEMQPEPEQIKAAAAYAKRAKSGAFAKQKETAVRQLFYDEILGAVLGYRRFSSEEQFDIAFERNLRRKPVDVALGHFFPEGEGDEVLAPFEMKGPDTADLDKIIPNRGFSPVQQAWDYAADAPGAKWVLVSNCLEIRLYAFGRGRDAYERFELARLDEPDELRRLLLVLSRQRLLDGGTERLLAESDAATKDITDQLYADYRDLRVRLIGYLAHADDGPKLATRAAIETAQKLLDRVIFIAFASGNGMLPRNIFKQAVTQKSGFRPEPVWNNVRALFGWIDKGNRSSDPHFDVWPYNGGLFADDPVADAIVLPDPLAEEMAKLVEWDYGREVSVTVLGHIFEQSIGDIEKLRDDTTATVSQRKREGVVYTPDHVTRFLVEKTIGATLAERFAALLRQHAGRDDWPDGDESPFADDATHIAFWNGYLDALKSLTIVDPACGSGAFLVAAYDLLAAEYVRVAGVLDDLGAPADLDISETILTRNLHGVDLNVESAEIARLALWLKSARREHRLARLDETIRAGNSLIDDAKASDRPFDWQAAFSDIFAAGGFDIVIGNPPYVRMEHLKDVKPWLAKHYAVADERTDLSAYFFEKGVNLLKPGGRLGYISTSSFFRAGYGEKLRLLLGERLDIETVVDYGDVQIFEGVTTYPAILTGKRKAEIAPPVGELRYLNIKSEAPKDIGRAFDEAGATMPRARLAGGSWQFEDAALARLRDKIVKGRKTLGEVYGAPLRGIVTGLNDAFVIDTATRDRLVKADPKSGELLKPFLKGENIKRWRVEPEGLWLINTPKGKVDIEQYPAIRDWLLPFRDRLESRATEQEWWELQQAQLAYQNDFEARKIVYQDICNSNPFSRDLTGSYLANTCYFLPVVEPDLLAFLNSKAAWFFWSAITNIARGGYLRLRTDFVEKTPLPPWSASQYAQIIGWTATCLLSTEEMRNEATRFHHRLLTDLATPGVKLSRKLKDFHQLDFAGFRAEAKKALKAEIPLKERGQWEDLFNAAKAEVLRLNAEIAAAEREIDRLVYAAFELTPDEIDLLEKSLDGQV